MKDHCVTVTQNYVRQFPWKIGGYLWQSTHGKRGRNSSRRKKHGSEILRHFDSCK